MLLKHVEQFAKSKGYEEVDLMVTKDNAVAVSFYESSEYEVERHLMTKKL